MRVVAVAEANLLALRLRYQEMGKFVPNDSAFAMALACKNEMLAQGLCPLVGCCATLTFGHKSVTTPASNMFRFATGLVLKLTL